MERIPTHVTAMALACLGMSLLTAGCTGRWNGLLRQDAADESVGQVLFVKCGTGSEATAEYYLRDGDAFRLCRTAAAHIGKNGIGKRREGDKRTPEGDFGIRCAFGILPDPGTSIEYVPVTESTYACDEECRYYNTIIDTVGTGHRCRGEHMIEYTEAYAYGISIDYNPGNIYPLGSAIFLHCYGRKPWTSGCVAVDEEMMRTILTTADSGLRIHIHPE